MNQPPKRGLVFYVCCLVLLGLVGSPHTAWATATPDSLAHSTRWKTLNYYHTTLDGSVTSEIVNDDYFVSPHGRTNPLAELKTFRELMLAYQAGRTDTAETLCRFPARLRFLRESDPALAQFSGPACAAYEATNHPAYITSVSLVFASGYFENPSSFFGHTMLKFNYGTTLAADQTAMDASLNYGAMNTDQPSNPLYVIRGIFGGYEANYKRNNEFLNSHAYTNVQVRDLWEYELALTDAQRLFVVERSWELMHARFDYYFFNDNCAHRIARLIEDATGKSLSDGSGFWLLPTQVVRQLNHGQGPRLIAQERYIPSLKTDFFNRYTTLSSDEKQQFERVLQLPIEAQKPQLATLPPSLLILLLDHYNLSLAKTTERPKNIEKIADINAHRAAVLSAMLQHPARQLQQVPKPEATYRSLADSRPTASLRLDYGIQSADDVFRLSYRPANNDLLDMPITGQAISRFTMGNAQLDWRNDDLTIRRVVVADILNLDPNPLPLSVSQAYSWGMRIDYAPRTELCTNCRSAGVEGKVGRTYQLDDAMIAYALFGSRVHSMEEDTESYANLVAELGAVAQFQQGTAVHLNAQYLQAADQPAGDYVLSAELRQQLNEQFDLRFTTATDGDSTLATTGLAYFFY